MILDCPTRGIDVGVKADMYRLMMDLKKQGKAIIMISEELLELIGMSDRMLIFKDGEITKELRRSADLEEKDVIEYII
jgi:ribose transport system ATP-binding protein